MKRESPANFFESAQRWCEETATYKGFYTFNFKDYQSEYKEAFGQLRFLNDESLSPKESITYTYEEDAHIVLLPIAGALNHSNGSQSGDLIRSEQIKTLEVKKGTSYTFNNPFEEDWINYLHMGFKMNVPFSEQQATLKNIGFKKMNELVSLGFNAQMQSNPTGYIGIYEGRSEEIYKIKKAGNGVFVYIIKGAFEVQGRLMEYRDGLSLWDTEEIEFEALSNNAIIMLLEINLK